MNKLIDNVTLVTIAFGEGYVKRAIKAFKYSLNLVPFTKVKLFTNHIERNWLDGLKIDVHKYPFNGISDYNKFMIYELHKFIDTSHALIQQEDGFILNEKKWENNWLNYDYIGAPWPLFCGEPGNITTIDTRVGNGGFCLRSKKLLKLCSSSPITNFFQNEDVSICRIHDKFFKEKGCIFAPVSEAMNFSMEMTIPEKNVNMGDIKTYLEAETFGFHSLYLKNAVDLLTGQSN